MGYMIIDISSGEISETTEQEKTDVTSKPHNEPSDKKNPDIEPLLPDGHIIERRERDEDAIRNEILKQMEKAT